MNSESSAGASPPENGPAVPPEWDRLTEAVRRLREEHAAWKRRAERAEARLTELESTLRKNSAEGEGLDAVRLAERVETLRQENEDLRTRLTGAREAIERITSRLQFMEDVR